MGLYGAAGSISALWIFVPAALVETARPLLLARFRQDPAGFRQGLAALYGLLWYGSCLAALVICLLSRPLLLLLYGQAYCPAWGILCVAAWRPAFSCLGIARSIFLAAHRQFRYEKYLAAAGAAVNLVLNLLLIPLWGPLGAALATLLAQAVANVGMNFLIPPLRENSRLLLQGMRPHILRFLLAARKRRQIHGRRPPHTP
ncbi:MAG: polysaccharide biosynthesis C-terminal domain-containing protein [Oscillospiraceae bacterium]